METRCLQAQTFSPWFWPEPMAVQQWFPKATAPSSFLCWFSTWRRSVSFSFIQGLTDSQLIGWIIPSFPCYLFWRSNGFRMDQGKCVCKLARRAFWQVSILWFLSYSEHKRMLCSSSCTFLAAILESATSPRKAFFSSLLLEDGLQSSRCGCPWCWESWGLYGESHTCVHLHMCVCVCMHTVVRLQTPPIPLHTVGFVLISTLSVLVAQPSNRRGESWGQVSSRYLLIFSILK